MLTREIRVRSNIL